MPHNQAKDILPGASSRATDQDPSTPLQTAGESVRALGARVLRDYPGLSLVSTPPAPRPDTKWSRGDWATGHELPYVGDPAQQRVNAAAMQTAICHPRNCVLYVSRLRWRDPGYALVYGTTAAKGQFHYVWPADREAVREQFGCLPEWPGEYVERVLEPAAC